MKRRSECNLIFRYKNFKIAAEGLFAVAGVLILIALFGFLK